MPYLFRNNIGFGANAAEAKSFLIGTRNKQFYFSLNREGKTKLIYLGKERVERAKEYSKNYKKHLEIVEEMTILNMELLKEDAFT